jgi:hypothetical protein
VIAGNWFVGFFARHFQRYIPRFSKGLRAAKSRLPAGGAITGKITAAAERSEQVIFCFETISL